MKDDGEMARNLIQAGLLVLVALTWFAAAGVRRSAARRRKAERQALVRRQARARFEAGMPAWHPDTPGPPGVLELAEHGELYATLAGLLADAGIGDAP